VLAERIQRYRAGELVMEVQPMLVKTRPRRDLVLVQTRPRRDLVLVTLAALAVAAVLIGVTTLTGGHRKSAVPGSWTPSAAQASAAGRAAQTEAWSGQPRADFDGRIRPLSDADIALSDPAAWPASVTSVQTLDTTRVAGMKYLDGSTGYDDRHVILYVETGSFETMTSAPTNANSIVKGSTIVFLVDPVTGFVSDFASFEPGSSAFTPVKDATTIFTR
jgi:hypothetical protein